MSLNIKEEVNQLVKYLQEKFKTNLPADYVPGTKYLDDKLPEADFETFIEQAKRATISPDGLITIDFSSLSDIKYPGLVIRNSYIDLAKRIIEKHEWTPDIIWTEKMFQELLEGKLDGLIPDVPPTRYLITGSPGTGKSAFCLFLMVLFVRSGNIPFIYNFQGQKGLFNNEHFYFVNDAFFGSGAITHFKLYFLYDDNNVATTRFKKATSLVFSSPRRDRYREYIKGGTVVYYMPLWSIEEVQKLNRFIAINDRKLSDAELKERFSWAGGVPRQIFVDWDKYVGSVRDAAQKIKPSRLGEPMRDMLLEKGPHCIIGAKVNIDAEESVKYQNFECCFISDKVLKEVVDFHTSNDEAHLKFILGIAKINTKTSLLHAAFQEAVGRHFEKGPLVKLTPLNDEGRSMVESRNLQLGRVFGNKWEISLAAPIRMTITGNRPDIKPSNDIPQLWIPFNTTFDLFDFIFTLPQPGLALPLIFGIQVTLNKEHGISHENLKKMADKFRGRFFLVWVVPPNIFQKFDNQAQLDVRKHPVPNADFPELVSVPQFKLDVFSDEIKELKRKKKKLETYTQKRLKRIVDNNK